MPFRWSAQVILIGTFALMPALASGVTVDQVVKMSKAGVSDAVIIEMIAREQTLVTMDPDQIMDLRRQGISDTVIVALLKSGVPAEESLRAEPLPQTPVEPIVVVVGHGPDRPNASNDFYGAAPPPQVVVVPVPYGVPFATPRAVHRPERRPERNLERTANPMLCVERVSNSPSPFAPALTRVTECPAVMQRSPR